MNKKLTSSILLVSVLTLLSGCNSNENPPKPIDDTKYTKDKYDFEVLYASGDIRTHAKYNHEFPLNNGCLTYPINKKIGANNYIRIRLNTNVNLVGYIYYTNADDPKISDSEKFYIKKDETTFTMFLDAYRNGAYAPYEKIINRITLQNVDENVIGKIQVMDVSVSDRTMDPNEELFISNDTMKFGTSFVHGGCIKHLERTDLDIIEYLDMNGDVCIDQNIDPESVRLVTDHVNFVNIFDLGREVQPSYYSSVQFENGHCPKTENLYGDASLSTRDKYNPIQCGSCGYKSPQIIDYIYKEDRIYIKTLGQDWFYDNDQCDGYIESDYSFGDDGTLIVRNTYTDFSQFIDTDHFKSESQETPATYFVYPLNYFYAETKQGIIFDNKVSEIGHNNEAKTSKNAPTSGDYYYHLSDRTMKTDWVAYVNENKFGAGILMPNADYYAGSRGKKSCNYVGEASNHTYSKKMFDFTGVDYIPSYAAANYNYINPMVVRKMVDFIPLQYDYAIYIGEVDDMREVFDELETSGTITNDSLVSDYSWPK